MLEVRELASVTAVPVDMLQVATAQFAAWEKLPNRKEILDRGIVEEAPECIQEMQNDNLDALAYELSDMQWYISERARLEGYTMRDICGSEAETLDDFQRLAVEQRDISPIWVRPGESIDPAARPDAALSLLALRVADAETMTEERLWRGYENGIPLHRLLRDLYFHVAVVADNYGFSLSYLLDRNIEKLSNRQRSSHVLEDQQLIHVSEVVDDSETTERKRQEAHGLKVARQREAIGGAIQYLFIIDDDYAPQQELTV